MKDKKSSWQSLIVTKAANCADTEKMPGEKQRKFGLRVSGCWNIGISLKGVGARHGRMGHHDSPADTKHFH